MIQCTFHQMSKMEGTDICSTSDPFFGKKWVVFSASNIILAQLLAR